MILSLLALAAQRPDPILESLRRPDLGAFVLFQAKDSAGNKLDCLKIELLEPGKYIGIHHVQKKDRFQLHLVESTDLRSWKPVRIVAFDAHQGTMTRVGSRWLLAWEQTTDGKNHLHVEAYASTKNLLSGMSEKSFDIDRTLSGGAEGTPSIESVAFNRGWDKSVIKLGFHYYRDLDVDRQASGTLRGFADWTAAPLTTVNKALEPIYLGNIGDRDSADFGPYRIGLLEAQETKNDWSSWRILYRVGGGGYHPLDIKTPGNSKSFANPSITALELPDGRPGAVVTMFLPSQGNAKDEEGEMIYAFPIGSR